MNLKNVQIKITSYLRVLNPNVYLYLFMKFGCVSYLWILCSVSHSRLLPNYNWSMVTFGHNTTTVCDNNADISRSHDFKGRETNNIIYCLFWWEQPFFMLKRLISYCFRIYGRVNCELAHPSVKITVLLGIKDCAENSVSQQTYQIAYHLLIFLTWASSYVIQLLAMTAASVLLV